MRPINPGKLAYRGQNILSEIGLFLKEALGLPHLVHKNKELIVQIYRFFTPGLSFFQCL